jgi:hypothetical protein
MEIENQPAVEVGSSERRLNVSECRFIEHVVSLWCGQLGAPFTGAVPARSALNMIDYSFAAREKADKLAKRDAVKLAAR